MSHSASLRRRAGLFASSSLIVASASVAFSMGLTVLAPSVAMAADECGVPAANGAAPDTFNCPGVVYPTGIIYPTTAGDLTLVLQEEATGAVRTTTGGIQVIGLPGDDLALNRALVVGNAGLGDPVIVNTLGAGISFTSLDSNIGIDLSDVDAGDAGIVVTGSTSGIVATTGGAGNVSVVLSNGTVTGQAGDGINVTAGALGTINVAHGAAVINATNTAPLGVAAGIYATGGSATTISGTGAINANGTYQGLGIVAIGDGAMNINQTGAITANGTYAWGVYARGTAGNSISITTGAINVTQTGAVLAGGDGISAYTTGAVTINSGAISTTGKFTDGVFVGGVFGIAGNTIVNTGAITTTGVDSDGVDVGAHGSIAITTAAITVGGANSNGVEATTDLSTVAVTTNGAVNANGLGSNGLFVRGQTGVTITTNAAVTANTNAINSAVTGPGNATINVGAASVVRAPGTTPLNAAIQVESLSGSTTTINNAGTIRSTNATVAGAAGDLAIQGVVGNVTVNNTGRIDGRMNFAGLTGTNRAQINVTGAGNWHTTGLTTLSGGNDVITNSGLISTLGTTTIDFAADTGVAPRDVFNNSGRLVAGETAGAATLNLTGLETFNNFGAIFFGSLNGGTTSDGETNDRIVMTGTGGGTAFVGSGGSVLAMDVNLGVTGQGSCAAAVIADCLSLPGGTVSGSTGIRINNTNTGPGGLNTAGITLVEAGAITPGSLIIDPSSANYVTRGGAGAIDTGFFFYRLIPQGTTRAALVSAPDAEAYEFVQLGGVASDVWHLTTGTWHDRQADLRDGFKGEGDRAGVWLKIFGEKTERDESASFDSLGTVFTFDTSFEQNTAGLVGGVDLIGGSSDNGGWLAGLSIGYVDSDVTFNETNTLYSLEGMTGGIYGSFVSGGWYVDANISGNWLDVEYNTPNSTPGVTYSETGSIDSLGAQIETGWRFPIGSTGFIEPMGSLSWVSTSFDDVTVPGGTVEIDDVDSLRGSLGLRVGMTNQFTGFRVQPSLYAKVWNEFSGDASTTFNNTGAPFTVDDEFSGTFADVGGQLNLFSDGGLTAFVNGGYKWNSDFNSTTVKIGFRYQF